MSLELFEEHRQNESHKTGAPQLLENGAAWILVNLGMVCHAIDTRSDGFAPRSHSEEYYRQALQLYEEYKQLATDSAAFLLRNMGVRFAFLRKHDEAKASFDAAEKIYRSLGQTEIENFAELRKSQAMLQLQLADSEHDQSQVLSPLESENLLHAQEELTALGEKVKKSCEAFQRQKQEVRSIKGGGGVKVAQELFEESHSILKKLLPMDSQINYSLAEMSSLYIQRGDKASATQAQAWLHHRGKTATRSWMESLEDNCDTTKQIARAALSAFTVKPMRLLCLDLDGTLLNKKHRVSAANAKAVATANANGYTIVLCTGRGLTMYMPTGDELGVTDDLFLVGFNGVVVHKLNCHGEIIDTFFETKLSQNSFGGLEHNQ